MTTASEAGGSAGGGTNGELGRVGPQLSLRISPRWENVLEVRQRTAAFLDSHGCSRDVVDATAMVACELTENAAKYGEYDDEEDLIDVHVTVGPKQIVIEVINPVSPTDSKNLTRLDQTVQWIRGFQDPFEAYLNRLRDLSMEGLEGIESRLGLVRIAYEGQAVLDFYVNERNVLAVSAIRRL